MSRASTIAIAALLACACSEPSMLEDEEGQGVSPASSEELYGAERVWHVDFELAEGSYQALIESPREYVPGRVRIGDTIIDDVGIRLKGAFSFQGLDGKASFKIKFNKFVEGQRFLGLEKLTLNNMRQDRSQVHEWLAYQVFGNAGVPAPRSGFAQVSVNGSVYGLYANVETIDDRFLDDRFAGGDGNLYEAPWGADLDSDSVDLFEQDEGEDLSRADLAELVLKVERDGDSVFFGDDAAIDTDEFLRFVVSEAVSGHWDGYWKSNNYFLYHESPVSGPGQGLWNFMPWGLDQSFGQELEPFSSRGVLAEKCFSLPSCMSEYTRIGLEVVESLEDRALENSIEAATQLIAGYVDEDPRSPHPPAKTARYRDIARARLEAVPDIMREHFSCMEEGVEQDRDGDGFGACFDDCNDARDDARPGAVEVCDGIDNDCDGQVDEAMCPCTEMDIGGATYLFCDATVSWSVANSQCGLRGGALAVFPERADSTAAFDMTSQIGAPRSWYVGATDVGDEGTWTGTDGSSIDDAQWFAPGEPDDFGGEHCAALASFAGGDWEDVRCGTLLPYICRVFE